jgi:hypothetical protein
MGRIILGVAVALLGAIAAQAVANYLSNLVYPAPPVANPFDQAGVAAAFAMRSTGNVALTSLSYFFGALAGGWAGGAIARRRWAAWVAAGVMLLFGLIVVLSFPNPGWATALTLIGPIAAALIVRRLLPDDPVSPDDSELAGDTAPGVSLAKERDIGPV